MRNLRVPRDGSHVFFAPHSLFLMVVLKCGEGLQPSPHHVWLGGNQPTVCSVRNSQSPVSLLTVLT